jgi:hypothetical protein
MRSYLSNHKSRIFIGSMPNSGQKYAVARSSRRRTSAVCWRIASCLALGWMIGSIPAQAQLQTQNGQALDANPQVGSGGSNTPIPGYVPLNPNIYGNGALNNGTVSVPNTTYQVVPISVPGGGTTYARIPAVNQSSFYSQIPANTLPLYTVNAVSNGYSINSINNSINQQVNTQNLGTVAGNNYGNGTLYGNGGMNYASPYGTYSGASSIYGGSSLVTPLPGYPIYNNNGQNSTAGQISPLFGLRQVEVQQASLRNSLNGQIMSGGSSSNTNNGGPGNGSYQYNTNSAQVNGQVNGQNNNNGQAQSNNLPQSIGQPIVGMVGAQKPNKPVPGDLYQQLIAELASGEKVPITAPGLPGKPAITQTTLNPADQQNQNVLQIDPITGLPIAPLNAQTNSGAKPESSGSVAAQNSSAGGNANNNTGVTPEPSGTGLSPGQSTELQAGQNLQPLNTLVSPAPDQFNSFMKAAQDDLKKGLYLYSIQDYQNAAMIDSNNMLPVVGQANAELAAGFYSSAIHDLKMIFTNHPELTAVRYNLPAMLPDNTLDSVTSDLESMATQKSSVAAFLLSYIYYQTGQTEQLKQLMNRWAGWNASDPWPAILRKAWLEKTPPDSATGSAPGAGSP